MKRSGLPKCSRMRPPPHRTDLGQLVEDRTRAAGRTPRRCRWKVTAKRWASSRTRCSSSEAGSSARSASGARAARHEDLFALLGEADDRKCDAALAHRLEGRRELPLAAVDHDQGGPRGEALVVAFVGLGCVAQAPQAAAHDLAHHGEVVLPGDRADRELAVVRLARPAVLEDHHRAHGMLLAQVRDVVALDAQRQVGEAERVAQPHERLFARLARARQARLLLARPPARRCAGPSRAAGAWGRAGRARTVDPRAAPRREHGRELGRALVERHDHLPRDAHAVAVVAQARTPRAPRAARGPPCSRRRRSGGRRARPRARGTPGRCRPDRPARARARRRTRRPRSRRPGAPGRGARRRAGRAAAPPSRTRGAVAASRMSRSMLRSTSVSLPRRKSITWPMTSRYSSCETRSSQGPSERSMKYCRQGEPLGRPGLSALHLRYGKMRPMSSRVSRTLRALEYGPK